MFNLEFDMFQIQLNILLYYFLYRGESEEDHFPPPKKNLLSALIRGPQGYLGTLS